MNVNYQGRLLINCELGIAPTQAKGGVGGEVRASCSRAAVIRRPSLTYSPYVGIRMERATVRAAPRVPPGYLRTAEVRVADGLSSNT